MNRQHEYDSDTACQHTKVGMRHRLLRSKPLLMIVPQQFVEEVDRFVADKALVLARNEPRPWFPLVSAENIVVLRVQIDIVLFQIRIQFVCSEYLCDLDELIVVVVPVEEGLFAEDLVRNKLAPQAHMY